MLGNLVQDVEQIPRRTGEPIEPTDNQRIAFTKCGKSLAQLRPVRARPDCFSLKMRVRTRLQFGYLVVERLAIRADAATTDDHLH